MVGDAGGPELERYKINNYFAVAAGVRECVAESLVLESASRAHNLSAIEDL